MPARKSDRPRLPRLSDPDEDAESRRVRLGDLETPSAPATERDVSDESGPLPNLAGDDGTRTDKTALVADLSVRSGDRPMLTVLSGISAGMVFPLDKTITTLGRGKDIEVVLRDAGVSRRHVRIVQRAGACILEDLGSTNGVRVNGKKTKQCELRAGDRIQLGPDVVLQFAYLDDAEENLTKQLYTAATRDALTQALNRRAFDERFQAELSYAKRHGTRLSVVLFDLDHFKRVNDTFGHAAGDLVLRETAGAVRRTIRSEDVFARYGGEEFVLLVRGESTAETAQLAERIRAAVRALAIRWEDRVIAVTLSAGVAELDDCKAAQDLVTLADQRLYRAKKEGRDRVVLA